MIQLRYILHVFFTHILFIPTSMMLTLHNTWGILNVFFIVWIRPMKGKLLRENHPFNTGICPIENKEIWPMNIVFTTPSLYPQTSDDSIVCSIGQYLRSMTKTSSEGIPHRMPPAINYLHGGIHYNGGYFIFNNFEEGYYYFTSLKFKIHFWNFILKEKREPIIIFRNKDYNELDYLIFVSFLRVSFPYFSNSNGNKKRIGWGNPAPYPSTNMITGHWKKDLYKIFYNYKMNTLARPKISKRYFKNYTFYKGLRKTPFKIEKLLASFTNNRVLARKEKGNIFFVDRRKLKKGYLFDPSNLPSLKNRLIEKFQDSILKNF